jgi:phospholipid/cholesterol/gamma-HCH transport system permease protein
MASAPPVPPTASWQADGDTWTLRLAGDWAHAQASLPKPPDATPPRHLLIDTQDLGTWDTHLAAALWQPLQGLPHPEATRALQPLPGGLRDILELSLPARPEPINPPAARRATPEWLSSLGHAVATHTGHVRYTLGFVGEVVLSCGRLLRGRSDLRWADLAWQLEQTGPRSLPIVSLVCGLVGLILAYMGAIQLQRMGAQAFIADLVTIAVVREIAALMMGVIMAGRIGAAFAAQIGSMQANEEIDALRTMGVNPVDHLVLPRLLAMLVVSPLLTAQAALMGMLAGSVVAVFIFEVPPLEYLNRSLQALSMRHVLIGLVKGSTYGVLVALAGCCQGLQAGRSALAVGQATTSAVVKGIVWIVVAASALTIACQRLGW